MLDISQSHRNYRSTMAVYAIVCSANHRDRLIPMMQTVRKRSKNGSHSRAIKCVILRFGYQLLESDHSQYLKSIRGTISKFYHQAIKCFLLIKVHATYDDKIFLRVFLLFQSIEGYFLKIRVRSG